MLNQEMMKLYKENGTSPFGACLPSLLQMPFLIVLYSLIRGLSYVVPKGQTYTNAAGRQSSVSQRPGAPRRVISQRIRKCTKHWWPAMAKCIGGSGWICRPFRSRIMPTRAVRAKRYWSCLIWCSLVLRCSCSIYQMKQMNSRNPQAAAANPQMQQMQKFFPIIFGVIYLRVPAGATIYMVVSSAMRIGTQEFMFRTGMVTPVVHEREIGSAQGAAKGEGETAASEGGQEDVDGDGRDGGCQGHVAAGQERRRRPTVPRRTAGRPPTGRSRRRGSERRTAGRRATRTSRTHRHPKPTRGRARSGQERLDSAWSGLKWRGRPSKRRPNRHWTSWALPSADAEVIVVDEPKTGLFGRVRVEARVRARVRPVGARPRRERSRRSGGGRSGQGGQGARGAARAVSGPPTGGGGRSRARGTDGASRRPCCRSPAATAHGTTTAGTGSGTSRSARRRRNRSKATTTGAASVEGSSNGSGAPSAEKAPQRSTEAKETEDMAEGMTLEEQGEVGRAFVADLLSEFGMEGTVETRLLDEDTVEIAALGEDLGNPGRPTGIDAGRAAGPDPRRGPASVPVAHGPHPGRRGRATGSGARRRSSVSACRSPKRSWPRARRRRSSR